MSPNRKAELQRKLTLSAVPKPPAGLADRIKSEIPQHLMFDAVKERRRFSQSIAFNLRVAASILLLVSSVYIALHVLSRYERPKMAEMAPVQMKKTAVVPAQGAPPPPKVEPLPDERNQPTTIAETRTTPPAPMRRRDEERPALTFAPEAAPPPPAPPVAQAEPATGRVSESVSVSAPAPAAAAAPSVAGGVAPSPQPSDSVSTDATSRRLAKKTNSFISEAQAADLAYEPKTLFGVSLKSVVQQFAAPPSAPSHVRLDVEAATIDERPTLRISVDTPDENVPPGGTRPPAAADAHIEIAFNPEAVISQRPLVGPIATSPSALPSSQSVTALYGLELKPDVGKKQVIATVRLHYRDVTGNGKQHVIERTIRRSDIRPWEHASRRTKSAILAEAIDSKQLTLDDIIARANAAGLSNVAAYAEQQKR